MACRMAARPAAIPRMPTLYTITKPHLIARVPGGEYVAGSLSMPFLHQNVQLSAPPGQISGKHPLPTTKRLRSRSEELISRPFNGSSEATASKGSRTRKLNLRPQNKSRQRDRQTVKNLMATGARNTYRGTDREIQSEESTQMQ